MTDRHAGYIVTLDHDMREDDAEAVLNALRMVRGVASVEPVPAQPLEQHFAEQRRDRAWTGALAQLIANGPESVLNRDDGH